jgi:glycosyltransferase involved in cell wall biosynthesis
MFIPKQMKPLRLLHVVGDSRFGGAAKIILRLGQVMKVEGWEVDVLTTDPIFRQAVIQHGLGLVNLDVIRREIRPIWDLAGLVRLRNFLRRDPYRIVHTHTSKAGFVGRLAACLANVPVIVHTAHGFAIQECSPFSARFFYSTLERVASRWCNRVVCVSEFHRRWALALGICAPREIVAIPNGVEDVRPNPEIKPSELRRRLGAQESDLLILTTSRLATDKGLEYLIEAAAMLPRTNFRVCIAGDGPQRSQLEQLACHLGVAERVILLGHREDVRDLLAACDLVVVASLREGLSMSLLEAMAAGKPIIATSIGSQRELASQADMARMVPPGDAPALLEAILELARDPALMARLGRNARVLFESRYTEDKMLSAYKQLYFDLLKSNGPEPANMADCGRDFSFTASRQPVKCNYQGAVCTPQNGRRVDVDTIPPSN